MAAHILCRPTPTSGSSAGIVRGRSSRACIWALVAVVEDCGHLPKFCFPRALPVLPRWPLVGDAVARPLLLLRESDCIRPISGASGEKARLFCRGVPPLNSAAYAPSGDGGAASGSRWKEVAGRSAPRRGDAVGLEPVEEVVGRMVYLPNAREWSSLRSAGLTRGFGSGKPER